MKGLQPDRPLFLDERHPRHRIAVVIERAGDG